MECRLKLSNIIWLLFVQIINMCHIDIDSVYAPEVFYIFYKTLATILVTR